MCKCEWEEKAEEAQKQINLVEATNTQQAKLILVLEKANIALQNRIQVLEMELQIRNHSGEIT